MNHLKIGNDKWYSETKFVDIDTGEYITKSLAQREYLILNNPIKQITENGNYKTITRTYSCKRNQQLKLF